MLSPQTFCRRILGSPEIDIACSADDREAVLTTAFGRKILRTPAYELDWQYEIDHGEDDYSTDPSLVSGHPDEFANAEEYANQDY